MEQITRHCVDRIKNKEIENTASDFGIQITQGLLDKLQEEARALSNSLQAIYPANSLQQGFIYHVLSQEQDDAYRVQILFDYHNSLNIENYKKAWELTIQSYPILRTSFNWEEDVIQIIHSKGSLNFTFHDISKEKLTEAKRDAKVKQIQEEDRRQGFDLTKPTQFRLHLVKHAKDHYTLLKSEHRNIGDGWSGPILLNKVHQFYQKLEEGIKPLIQEDQSYLKAQKYYQEHRREIKEYWDKQIKTIEQTNDLNALLSQTVDLESIKFIKEAKEEGIQITGELYQGLKRLSKEQGITINTVVQFAWHKLLQTYTRDEQTIVGTTVSGRNIPIEGIEDSVGLYINTLPLIIDWKDQRQKTIAEQLKYIHQRITEVNNYSYANLAELQKQGKRLFHSLFVFENYSLPEEQKGESRETLISLSVRGSVEKLNYPLGVIAYENSQSLILKLKYAGEYITSEKIANLLSQLQRILGQLLEVNNKISDISLLTKEEYKQIVYDYNQTDKEYPKDKTTHQLFEEQVERVPNNTALVFEGEQLTYKELNAKANQLARYIRKQYKERTQEELKPDTLVALCLDRSNEMIIAILAVLKAGGAYVPIDPSYPAERIDYILKDTKADLVIMQERLQQLLDLAQEKSKLRQLIVIDNKQTQEKIGELHAKNLKRTSTPRDLAYVIYTSGTTGQSKGVMVEHVDVVQFCINNNYCAIDEKSIFAGISNYAFDGSIFDIFASLLNGSRLVLFLQSDLMDLSRFAYLVKKEKINTVFITTALFDEFSRKTLGDNPLLNIKNVLFGGQKVNIVNVGLYLSEAERCNLVHVYGPTETIVYASKYLVSKDNSEGCPIGSALSNKRLYILSSNIIPVPIGVTGELYIGGAGLARGYLNRPALTKERFVENPFATEEDRAKGYTRLYKTGDLVRWLPDGNIEYIGRNDFQVKIRGFRIELGEIENTISKIKGIKQVTVQARERQTEAGLSKYLVAYYIAETQTDKAKTKRSKITQEDIIHQLKQSLPEYMVPSAFVEMKSFPLTTNGKLERNGLPNAEFTQKDSYVAPTNEFEQQLCTIWQEVLGIEKIGIKDDFYRIGGDSLSVVRLIGLINDVFGIKCAVAWARKNNTVSKQSNEIRSRLNQIKKYQPIINFNYCSNGLCPLFMVHPGLIGAEIYAKLANLLGRNITVYGIDSYNLYNDPMKDSVCSLAQYYAGVLLKMKNLKRVFLGGWSLGALLAFEIAQILKTKGILTEKLYMIDPDPPSFGRSVGGASELDKGQFNDTPEYIIDYLKNLPSEISNKIWENFASEVFLSKNYIAKKYDVQVTLFEASDASYNSSADDKKVDLGASWKKFIKYLKVIKLSGNHFTIMDGKGLDCIVKTIRNDILTKS